MTYNNSSNIDVTGVVAMSSVGVATGIPYSTVPGASTIAEWDTNSNLSSNSFIEGYTTTVTAGATTTLTVASTQQQYFTGSTTQICVLPDVSTLVLGQSFIISNLSTGNVTIKSSGGGTLGTIGTAQQLIATVIAITGTGTASWFGSFTGIQAITTVGDVTTGTVAFNGSAGTTLTSTTAGFNIETESQGAGTNNTGASVTISAGYGGTLSTGGDGGEVNIYGGEGGGTTSTGGAINIVAGEPDGDGTGGNVTISGGGGGANTGSGGDVIIIPGEPSTSGSCGNISIGNVTAAFSGTNAAAGNIDIYIPQGTGTGAVGKQTFYGDASGTSSGATGHNTVQRLILNGSVALTTTVSTTIATLTLASNSSSGGCITYLVECTDGTDFQAASGIVPFSAINKAGTKSGNTEPQDESQTRSSGTLTNVFSVTSGGLVQITSTTSLTPTFYQITYEISCLSAKQTITIP